VCQIHSSPNPQSHVTNRAPSGILQTFPKILNKSQSIHKKNILCPTALIKLGLPQPNARTISRPSRTTPKFQRSTPLFPARLHNPSHRRTYYTYNILPHPARNHSCCPSIRSIRFLPLLRLDATTFRWR
jgi:hypothetical protein